MRITLAVARLEVLLLLRDRRFLIACVALWGLLGVLLWVGQSRFVVEQQRLKEAQRISREQWVNREQGNAHTAAHVGTYVYRPATPLSLLHPGAGPYMGVAAHLEAHQQADLFYRPMLDRASVVRWADTSATTLLQIVIPLLLLLLACGSIAGDREEGRLLFSLSQGASPTTVALGKLAGVIAIALLLISPVMAIVALMIGRASGVTGAPPDQAARLFVLLAGYGAVYLFFLSVGIAVSAFSSTRQTALLVSVGLWAVLCLIAPRTLVAVAEQRFPTPENDVLQSAIREEGRGVEKILALRKRVEDKAMRRYKVRAIKDLPIDIEGLYLQAGEEFVNEIEDRHNGKVWAQFQAQENWATKWGYFLSPTATLKGLGESLSATDAPSLRAFLRNVESYRRDWVRKLNDAVTHSPRRKRGEGRASTSGREVWAGIPAFQYQSPTVKTLAPQTDNRLAVLWLWALLGVGVAVYGVRLKSGANHAIS